MKLRRSYLWLIISLCVGISLCVVYLLLGPVYREDAHQISFGPAAEMIPLYSPDGKWIVFEYFHDQFSNYYPQIWIIPANDSGFQKARPLVDDGHSNAELSWSPDSKWVSYIKYLKGEEMNKSLKKDQNNAQIWKVSIETGEKIQLTDFSSEVSFSERTAWSPDGKLIAFESDGDIYAISANSAKGEHFRLIDVISHEVYSGEMEWLNWSPDGTKFLFVARAYSDTLEGRGNIWILENKSQAIPKPIIRGEPIGFPSWSPDSKYVCIIRGVGPRNENGAYAAHNIFIYSLEQEKAIQVTTASYLDFAPSWSPDGSKIVFCRNTEFKSEMEGWLPWVNFHLWEVKVPDKIAKSIRRNLASKNLSL